MRIVHISDIHVACWTADVSVLCDKRILGLLNYTLRRRPHLHPRYLKNALLHLRLLGPDLVVVSGDLTCVGTPQEFNRALMALAPLSGKLNYEVVYVPGNHDAYVRDRSCQEALSVCFRRLNHDRWQLGDLPGVLTYPKLKIMVADECSPSPVWSSAGRLTAATRAGLRAWFDTPREPGEKRILVGHFPLRDVAGQPLARRRALADDAFLCEAFDAGKFDVSLCGHIHTPFVRAEPGNRMEICAGALTVCGQMNVLDYAPATGRFSQSWEDLRGDGCAAVPLTDTWVPAGAGGG